MSSAVLQDGGHEIADSVIVVLVWAWEVMRVHSNPAGRRA